jgi:hypothetical protein
LGGPGPRPDLVDDNAAERTSLVEAHKMAILMRLDLARRPSSVVLLVLGILAVAGRADAAPHSIAVGHEATADPACAPAQLSATFGGQGGDADTARWRHHHQSRTGRMPTLRQTHDHDARGFAARAIGGAHHEHGRAFPWRALQHDHSARPRPLSFGPYPMAELVQPHGTGKSDERRSRRRTTADTDPRCCRGEHTRETRDRVRGPTHRVTPDMRCAEAAELDRCKPLAD